MYLQHPSQTRRLSRKLKLDLEKFPDFTFNKTSEYTSSNGEVIPIYVKKLNPPCFELFDILEYHGKGEIRMLYFECAQINGDNFNKFIKVINVFWLYNREDAQRRGRVSKEEQNYLSTDQEIEREWINCRYPVELYFSKKMGFRMTVFLEYRNYMSDEEIDELED